MRLGDHEVVRLLGRGAMGSVYEVRHTGTGVRYAAKVLGRADDHALERFRREAELLARCDRHPGIVHVHHFGVIEGVPYMILDLVEGEDLEAVRSRAGKLDPRRAIAIARDVASALGFMHARGIVHRDVKPANVLLDREGRVRLSDFGIAAALDLERLTRTGTFVGTLVYASPEQVTGGGVTPASDVFALGCMLYELVSGRLPIEAATVADHMRELGRGDLAARARALDVAPAVAATIARALERSPADRFADGTAMAGALDAVLAGKAGRAPGTKRARALAVGAVALVGGALALLATRAESARSERRALARDLAAVARARLGRDDAGALLIATAAIELGRAEGAPPDAGCHETAARAALARGTDSYAVAAATSALLLDPSRREELLLVRARARLGERDVDGAIEDLRSLGSVQALHLRAEALLVGRRWNDLLRIGGAGRVGVEGDGPPSSRDAEDPFVAAARAVARFGRVATEDDRRIGELADSARREVRDAPGGPELSALVGEIHAIAEIAAVASLVGTHPGATLTQWDIGSATMRDPDVLFRPLSRAARDLERALETPRYLDIGQDLESLDLALMVIEADPVRMRTGQDVDPQPSKKRSEVEGLALAFEAMAQRIAPRPVDALSHRVRTFTTLLRLGLVPPPEHRRFLEEHVGTGSPLLDARIAAAILDAGEDDFIEGRDTACSIAATFRRYLERIDPGLLTRAGTLGVRVHHEVLMAEICVRAAGEDPAAATEHLDEAERHVRVGRRILERAGERVASHTIMGHDTLLAEAALALARGDRAATRLAIAALGEEDAGTRDYAEVVLRAEAKRREGDVAGAERLLGSLGQISADMLWFQYDWVVARELLRNARGDPDALATLRTVAAKRSRHPPLLPWIEKELREVLAK